MDHRGDMIVGQVAGHCPAFVWLIPLQIPAKVVTKVCCRHGHCFDHLLKVGLHRLSDLDLYLCGSIILYLAGYNVVHAKD